MNCNECSYAYELTKEQKENYDGSCGCKALEDTGKCPLAEGEEE